VRWDVFVCRVFCPAAMVQKIRIVITRTLNVQPVVGKERVNEQLYIEREKLSRSGLLCFQASEPNRFPQLPANYDRKTGLASSLIPRRVDRCPSDCLRTSL
jgi:hypothetical protein